MPDEKKYDANTFPVNLGGDTTPAGKRASGYDAARNRLRDVLLEIMSRDEAVGHEGFLNEVRASQQDGIIGKADLDRFEAKSRRAAAQKRIAASRANPKRVSDVDLGNPSRRSTPAGKTARPIDPRVSTFDLAQEGDDAFNTVMGMGQQIMQAAGPAGVAGYLGDVVKRGVKDFTQQAAAPGMAFMEANPEIAQALADNPSLRSMGDSPVVFPPTSPERYSPEQRAAGQKRAANILLNVDPQTGQPADLSAAGTAGRFLAGGMPGNFGGFAGAEGLSAGTSALLAARAPGLSPVARLVAGGAAGLLGAVGGGHLVSQANDWFNNAIYGEGTMNEVRAFEARQRQRHPAAATIGQVAGQGAFQRFTPGAAVKDVGTASNIKSVMKAAQGGDKKAAEALQSLAQGGAGSAIGVTTAAALGERDPYALAGAAAGGSLFRGNTPIGDALNPAGMFGGVGAPVVDGPAGSPARAAGAYAPRRVGPATTPSTPRPVIQPGGALAMELPVRRKARPKPPVGQGKPLFATTIPRRRRIGRAPSAPFEPAVGEAPPMSAEVAAASGRVAAADAAVQSAQSDVDKAADSAAKYNAMMRLNAAKRRQKEAQQALDSTLLKSLSAPKATATTEPAAPPTPDAPAITPKTETEPTTITTATGSKWKVTDKASLKTALMNAFGHDDRTASLHAELVDRFATGWANHEAQKGQNVTKEDFYANALHAVGKKSQEWINERVAAGKMAGTEKASYTRTKGGAQREIFALNAPDGSSALHELAHVFYDNLSVEEQAAYAAERGTLRGADTFPSTNAHERFVRDFIEWMDSGAAAKDIADNPQAPLFTRFRDYLRGLGQSIRDTMTRWSGGKGGNPYVGAPFRAETVEALKRYFDYNGPETTPGPAGNQEVPGTAPDLPGGTPEAPQGAGAATAAAPANPPSPVAVKSDYAPVERAAEAHLTMGGHNPDAPVQGVQSPRRTFANLRELTQYAFQKGRERIKRSQGEKGDEPDEDWRNYELVDYKPGDTVVKVSPTPNKDSRSSRNQGGLQYRPKNKGPWIPIASGFTQDGRPIHTVDLGTGQSSAADEYFNLSGNAGDGYRRVGPDGEVAIRPNSGKPDQGVIDGDGVNVLLAKNGIDGKVISKHAQIARQLIENQHGADALPELPADILYQEGKGGRPGDEGDTLFQEPEDRLKGQANSERTQIATTVGTYDRVGARGASEGAKTVLDYGAGLGMGADAMRKHGLDVTTFEPHPQRWRGSKPADFTDPSKVSGKYDRVVSLNVVNVLEPELRANVIRHIGSLLKDDGVAIVGARKWSGDVAGQKNGHAAKEHHAWWNDGVYQRGFDGNELKEFAEQALGPGFEVRKTTGAGASAVEIRRIKNSGDEGDTLFQESEDARSEKHTIPVFNPETQETHRIDLKVSMAELRRLAEVAKAREEATANYEHAMRVRNSLGSNAPVNVRREANKKVAAAKKAYLAASQREVLTNNGAIAASRRREGVEPQVVGPIKVDKNLSPRFVGPKMPRPMTKEEADAAAKIRRDNEILRVKARNEAIAAGAIPPREPRPVRERTPAEIVESVRKKIEANRLKREAYNAAVAAGAIPKRKARPSAVDKQHPKGPRLVRPTKTRELTPEEADARAAVNAKNRAERKAANERGGYTKAKQDGERDYKTIMDLSPEGWDDVEKYRAAQEAKRARFALARKIGRGVLAPIRFTTDLGRSLTATADNSFNRQTAIISTPKNPLNPKAYRPLVYSNVASMKAALPDLQPHFFGKRLGSEKGPLQNFGSRQVTKLIDNMKADPDWATLEEAGFRLGSEQENAADIGMESFGSKLAEGIPGVGASERGYKAGIDVAKFWYLKGELIRLQNEVKLGRMRKDQMMENLRGLVNVADVTTGQGDLTWTRLHTGEKMDSAAKLSIPERLFGKHKEAAAAVRNSPYYRVAKAAGLKMGDGSVDGDPTAGMTMRDLRRFNAFVKGLEAIADAERGDSSGAGTSARERGYDAVSLAKTLNKADDWRLNRVELPGGAKQALSLLIRAPRWTASRFQINNPAWISKLPPAARESYIQSRVMHGLYMSSVLTAAAAAGAKIWMDLDSRKFLTIQFGDRHYSIDAQTLKESLLPLHMIFVGYKTSKETAAMTPVERIDKVLKDEYELVSRYARYKANPVIGLAASLYTGKNAIGEDAYQQMPAPTINGQESNLPVNKELASAFIPMIFNSALDAWNTGEMRKARGEYEPGGVGYLLSTIPFDFEGAAAINIYDDDQKAAGGRTRPARKAAPTRSTRSSKPSEQPARMPADWQEFLKGHPKTP